MKTCSKCRRELPLSEFNKHAGRKDGLQACCRSCKKAYRNKDKQAEYNRKHREKHGLRTEYNAEYRREHRKRLREYNKRYQQEYRRRPGNFEKEQARKRKWRSENQVSIRARDQRREARRRGATVKGHEPTAQQIQWRWDMWGGNCWCCGQPANETDHVKPISKGGLHIPANLRPICSKCNGPAGKWDKWPLS